MAKQRGSSMVWLVLFAVIAIPIGAVYVIWGTEIGAYWANSSAETAFKDQFAGLYSQALNIMDTPGGAERAQKSPVRGNKCVCLHAYVRALNNRNELELKVNPNHGYLPAELRASTLEEADTLVIMRPDARAAMDYQTTPIGKDLIMITKRETARLSSLEVMIVDLKNKKYLGRKVFGWEENEQHPSIFQRAYCPEFLEWYAGLSTQ